MRVIPILREVNYRVQTRVASDFPWRGRDIFVGFGSNQSHKTFQVTSVKRQLFFTQIRGLGQLFGPLFFRLFLAVR